MLNKINNILDKIVAWVYTQQAQTIAMFLCAGLLISLHYTSKDYMRLNNYHTLDLPEEIELARTGDTMILTISNDTAYLRFNIGQAGTKILIQQ